MKLILYMAMTVNGFVATEEGATDWVSKEDWERFRKVAKETGNVIIGRTTYETMIEEKTFPLPDCLNVVMTREAPKVEPMKNVVFTDKSAEEVLEDLAKEGFESALLAGGGELNGSFMADGLIDEIYLTVSPVAFGEGVKLFGSGFFKRELDLLGVEKVSDSEVQLHYRVKRPTLEDYIGE